MMLLQGGESPTLDYVKLNLLNSSSNQQLGSIKRLHIDNFFFLGGGGHISSIIMIADFDISKSLDTPILIMSWNNYLVECNLTTNFHGRSNS